MAFINHISFKAWKGNLLVGGLAAQKLYRCVVNGNSIVSSDIVEGISGRVRHVVQGPNGSVYVAIEGPGRIVEIKAQ